MNLWIALAIWSACCYGLGVLSGVAGTIYAFFKAA